LAFLVVRLAMAKQPKSQIQKFREAARAAEADESEERFDETLKGFAKSKREPKEAGQDGKTKPDE
jgi:hypothetical protein